MNERTLFAVRLTDTDLIHENIASLFFSSESRVFRHKFSTSFFQTEVVDTTIFSQQFFLDSKEILVAFPNGKGLDIFLSKNQNDLRSYLLEPETIDYETDIYLFSSDLCWCIRYLDEFYDDNSRMTYLHFK